MNGRTNVTVGTSTDLQIPLDPCTSLGLTAGNTQVKITWTDPVDKYATSKGETAQDPQPLVSVWDHTVLVRKTGSQPTGPNDGTTVVSSSVRNQYQSAAYTDTGLMNDTTYHYGAFAYNTAGLASDGIFDSATPIPKTPLKNLAVGTVVKTPIDGTSTEFIVVHQGKPGSMYDDSCNGTWLLMKDIYENRQWDSSNTNDYEKSTIHSYLNGTFLGLFDPEIQAVIKQVKIPYRKGSGTSKTVASGANGLSCKIFLLSSTEVSFNHNYMPTNEGAELSYFAGCADNSSDSKRVAYLNNSATEWWLRSPDTSNSNYALGVLADGNWNNYHYGCRHSIGVRPALALPSDIFVDNEMNILA